MRDSAAESDALAASASVPLSVRNITDCSKDVPVIETMPRVESGAAATGEVRTVR
jgi:hypothetical protein